MLTIRKFFAYSIVLHIAVFIVAFFIVLPVKDKKREEFFARLVSPEEFLPPAPPISAIPKAKPLLPARPETQPRTHEPPSGMTKDRQTVPDSEGLSSPRLSSSPVSPGKSAEGEPDIGSSENKGATRVPRVPSPSTKEKLFDRNIIGDIAKRDVTKGEKEGQTFSFDVKEMRYLPYLRRLRERIESIWIYPPDAAAKGIYGDLIIKFAIKKNGRLGSVELVRTSGHKDLDDAALRALRDADPFWPLPDEWGMEAYTIQGHFVYTIYGYYVR
jgi:periplasmic protein TonB